MNFTPSDEQINAYRRIAAPTISETVSKQTPFGIIYMEKLHLVEKIEGDAK